MLLVGGGASPLLGLLLLLLVAAEAAVPMELYFSPAELVRIAGYGEEPVSSVSVSGQLACELCLRPGPDVLALELPGAKVAVTCKTEGPSTTNNSAFTTTDEYGNFSIDLPPRLHATPDMEKACSVMVLELQPDSACCLPSSSYGLSLTSSEDGVRAYTAGMIRLQHNSPFDECLQEERSDMR